MKFRIELSKKNITGKIICWACRSDRFQLFRVKNKEGKKTLDYICVRCKYLGSYEPPIGNVSIVKLPVD